MAGPKFIDKGFQFWPANEMALATDDVVRMYERGFAGAYQEPEETEQFEDLIRSRGGNVRGEEIATSSGWAESGQGKLILPFLHALEQYPGCLPGPGQQRGDCVAHSEKNANLITYACEVAAGLPDEVTGLIERVPEIPTAGLLQGAFSTETFYWFRGHGGDGWSCDASSRVAMRNAGLITRDNHADLGVDLTRYSGRNAGLYGRRPPTGSVATALAQNLIRQATTVRDREARRDFLANGYALHTCGGEGWANTRDKHGVSRRRGGWAHAMPDVAFDDRPSTRQLYGDSLELIQNSWARWNSGPRDIRDSAQYVPPEKRERWIALDIVNPRTGNIMIPHGSFWALSRDVSRRRFIAKSSVDGWPRLSVPHGHASW